MCTLHENPTSHSGLRWPVARTGAQTTGDALALYSALSGGEGMTGAPVESIDEFAPVRAICSTWRCVSYCGMPPPAERSSGTIYDAGLVQIAEIVHENDLRDGAFREAGDTGC